MEGLEREGLGGGVGLEMETLESEGLKGFFFI